MGVFLNLILFGMKTNGNIKEKGACVVSPQSKLRERNALLEGRMPHKNGRPFYLEKEEQDRLIQEVVLKTLSFDNPTLKDVAKMVYIYFY
jgi:hypothetical protein